MPATTFPVLSSSSTVWSPSPITSANAQRARSSIDKYLHIPRDDDQSGRHHSINSSRHVELADTQRRRNLTNASFSVDHRQYLPFARPQIDCGLRSIIQRGKLRYHERVW